MEEINYDQLSIFKDFYFEDSYLLNITSDDNLVSLNVLAVLTPKHPLYHPAFKGDQHCYKTINIDFPNAKNIHWFKQNLKKIPSTLDVIEDYGNIDVFYKVGEQYYIEGGWGALEFISDVPQVSYLSD